MATQQQPNLEAPASEPKRESGPPPASPWPAGRRPIRPRTRLARGPLAIGDPAPAIDPWLSMSDPYRPDTIADGGQALGLTIRAASVRGLSKRFLGGPRQDDLCLRGHPGSGTMIVAVADGVSAAARSELGAALAVRQASAEVARRLDEGQELEWASVFQHAAWALVEEHRRASGDAAACPRDAAGTLATTLTVAAISGAADADGAAPSLLVRVAAVGDSPAFALADGEFETLAGETASGAELVGGGVHALPGDTDGPTVATRTLPPGAVLLLCTDGLALPLADGAGDVGRALVRELSRPPDIVDFARLLDFSRATYDDDRTLVAVWPQRRP